jgi:hypothetical protein
LYYLMIEQLKKAMLRHSAKLGLYYAHLCLQQGADRHFPRFKFFLLPNRVQPVLSLSKCPPQRHAPRTQTVRPHYTICTKDD